MIASGVRAVCSEGAKEIVPTRSASLPRSYRVHPELVVFMCALDLIQEWEMMMVKRTANKFVK